MFRNWIRVSCCVVLAMSSAYAGDDSPSVSAGVTFGSDYIFRGTSQTLGGAAVQATLETEWESGLYAYVWGSNIDFVPEGEPDDGANIEVDVAVGYAHELTDRWLMDVKLVRYFYPGTADGASYDYNELIATAWYDERYYASLGYSNKFFGMDAGALFSSIGTSYTLPADLSLALEYGYYDLEDAYGASYSYVNVGIGRPIGNVEVTLAYIDTFGDPEEIFYAQSTGSRVVLTIDIGF